MGIPGLDLHLYQEKRRYVFYCHVQSSEYYERGPQGEKKIYDRKDIFIEVLIWSFKSKFREKG